MRKWEESCIIYRFFVSTNVRYFIVGLVYPFIFVGFFGVLRYFVLGIEKSIALAFFNSAYCIYFICFIFLSLLFIIILVLKYAYFRDFFYENTRVSGYSINLFLLRYSWYKWFPIWNHKVHFVISEISFTGFVGNFARKIEYLAIYKFFTYLWRKPKIFLWLLPIFFVFELLLTHKIFHFYYFLFVFFCVRLVLSFFAACFYHPCISFVVSDYLNNAS